jgi:polysaccharide deacetylase family protein (PEP-CTERM system associated)
MPGQIPTTQDSAATDSHAAVTSPATLREGVAAKCIFSVDVEDWFHILDIPATPPLSQWDSLPSLVEKNFRKLLDIFAEKNVHVTCFFLGWVAEKFPHLVKEAAGQGHEIASHGYAHRLVYELTREEFLEDALRSKNLLEDLTGQSVLGYRSSGFSVTEKTSWFFDMLMEAGYQYDSSVFPAPREHGGLAGARLAPYRVEGSQGSLIEFPLTVRRVFGKPICFFGGGYLRLFPYFLIRRMTLRVLEEGRPVIFYVHPREIDPEHPRLPMGTMRAFKSYVNLATTRRKIRRLASQLELMTFRSFIEHNRGQLFSERDSKARTIPEPLQVAPERKQDVRCRK